jgi:electron transfer flavoprotein beta subunit
MATFAATIREENAALLVSREVDGGVATLRVGLPAVVTVDLRIVAPTSVYSLHTDQAHKYAEGVRFAPLPAIMAAKKKPLDVKALAELVPGATLGSRTFKFEKPAARSAGVKVKDAAELVDKLVNTAKVV